MENKTVVLADPKEFGLEDGQANEIIGNLPELIEERKPLIERFKEVMSMDADNPESEKIAKEVRLSIRDHRTKGIEVWHRLKKDVFLRGGQFVDALKKDQVAINQDMESKLMEIEKRAEILEKKRMEALQNERVELLSLYVEDANERDLSGMEEDVWNAYFGAKKKAHEDRIAAEKKAEADRIEAERKEAEENERIRKENERLQKEAEEKEAEREKERKAEAAKMAKIEEDRAKERKAESDRLAKIEAERKAEREKLKALEEKQAKEAAAKKAAEEAKLAQGDTENISDLIAELEALKVKYTFKSAKNTRKYQGVKQLIDKVVNYIKE